MKRIYWIVLVFVIALSLILSSYGYQRLQERTPVVSFTKVNFNVTYSGNYTGYILPGIDYKDDTPVQDVYRHGGNWFLWLQISLQCNKSSALYASLNGSGYGLNNSVVLDSVSSTTTGFSVYSFDNDPGGNTEHIVNPVWGYMPGLSLEFSRLYYQGPLNLTLKLTSPAKDLVFYPQSVILDYKQSVNPGVYIESSSISASQFGTSTCVSFVNQSIEYSIILESAYYNFSVYNVSVSSPFVLGNTSPNLPVWARAATNNGSYSLEINVHISMPDYPMEANLILTIYASGGS